MPADEHELALALQDGVTFAELAAPVKQADGMLTCERMVLGQADASGRRSPVGSGEFFDIPCDLVISAVGEQVDERPDGRQRHRGGQEGPSRLPDQSFPACMPPVTPPGAPPPWWRASPTPPASPRRSSATAYTYDIPAAGVRHQDRRPGQEGHPGK